MGGTFRCGYPLLPFRQDTPHFRDTIISLEEGAQLITKGNVAIAPGVAIYIGKNATLTFHGNNSIAHNSFIICNKDSEFGKNSGVSWNVTLIDDDNHVFKNPLGKKIKKISKGFKIGENAGIQMNSTMPSAKVIGRNSIVAANTVIRRDVPDDSLVYSETQMKIKTGFTTGLGYVDED